jgi:cysteine desulfurase/selenocysteine lyase
MNVPQKPNDFKRPFNVARIRDDFPILSRAVNGRPLVYLDNAASAQKPEAVIEAIAAAMRGSYANVHRGLHTLANETTAAFEAARETVARLINAPQPESIVFTKGGTQAINIVANGVDIQPGDEIVLSVMEHHSNIVPWHFLRERKGAVLQWLDIDDDGGIDIDALDALIGPRTKMVAISHMSNVLGARTPAPEIVRIAHAKGVPVLLDGCQAVVHSRVDVQALDVDFYAFTGHKLYGPTGIGILWGRFDLLKDMRPFEGGGEMILDVFEDQITYAEPPHRFEAGTPPIIEAIGLGAALRYVEQVGREAIAAHEHDLIVYATERLSRVNSLRIFGTAPGKGAILSFALGDIHAHDVSMVIDRAGVAVRAGTPCAQPLMARFGVTSTCRASFAMYNTRAEIDVLAQALEKARSFFA